MPNVIIVQNTKIPFGGFYESFINGEIDDAEKHIMEHDDIEALDVNYANVRKAIAVDYAEWFVAKIIALLDESGETLSSEFGAVSNVVLRSPREYNFETDTINCDVSQEFLSACLNFVNKDRLQSEFDAHFTSCSGFWSYYDTTVPATINEFDHNQIYVLLTAVCGQFEEFEYDHAYVEDRREFISNTVDNNAYQ